MSLEELIIAIVRILGALPVLRWAFAGGIIAILVDLSDLFLKNLLDLGGVSNYQALDKWLDQAYMVTFLIVALRWAGVERSVAVGLFAFRMVGFVAFEVSGERGVLLAFPNLFEFWFLFVAGLKHWRPDERLSWGQSALVAAPLLVLKLFQEYALHVGAWFDDFTAVEAVEAIRDWLWPF